MRIGPNLNFRARDAHQFLEIHKLTFLCSLVSNVTAGAVAVSPERSLDVLSRASMY